MFAFAIAIAVAFASPANAGTRDGTGAPLAAPTGERVVVEVHVGRFATRTVLAYEQPDGELLVPVLDIMSLAGISVRVQYARLQGRQSKNGPTFSYDFQSRVLRFGTVSWRMNAHDIARNKDGLWVSMVLLKKLLGVEVNYDRNSADLDIRDAERFPVGMRAVREATVVAQRSKLVTGNLEPVSNQPDLASHELREHSVVLDYQITHHLQLGGAVSSNAPARSDLDMALGASFPVARGVMNVRAASSNAFGALGKSLWWTLTRPSSNRFRELSLGKVRSRGLQSQEVRGFFLTNGSSAPELAASKTNYALTLPDNWQLDVFRGSSLISTSTGVDGQHNLPVTLLYGTNTIDFVARGPDGQERMFQRSFHTPSMYVASGTVDYAVAAGLCERNSGCQARLNADVRVNIGGGMVGRAGVDARLGSHNTDRKVPSFLRTSEVSPYVNFSAVIKRSTVVDASIQPTLSAPAQSHGTAQIRFEPNPNFILSADASTTSVPLYGYTVASANPASNVGDENEWHQWMRSNRITTYLHYAPSFVSSRASLEAWSSVQTMNAALTSTSRVGLSTQTHGIQVRPYARFETRRTAVASVAIGDQDGLARMMQHTSYQGIDAMLVPTWHGATSVGNWWVRGGLETSRNHLDNWSASLTRSMGRWRVDAGILSRSGGDGTAWTLSLVSELPQLQTSHYSSSGVAKGRATSVTQMQGSAIFDGEQRRLTLSAEPTSGRSGIAGVVFLDDNGDGIKQANEMPVPDVLLYVNNKSLISDKRGAFMAWGLPGYATQQIFVDTSSLSDPTWRPTYSFNSVRTQSGTLVTVNIPIVTAATLYGSIRIGYTLTENDTTLMDSVGVRWSTPVRMVVKSVRTGLTRVMDTFSDGSFFEEGVTPGEYIISIDEKSLAGTGLKSSPVHTVVLARNTGNALSKPGTTGSPDLVLWLHCAAGPSTTNEQRCTGR